MAKINVAKKKKEVPLANPFRRIAAFFIDLLLLQFIVVTPFRSFFDAQLPAETDFTATYNFISSNPAIINNFISALITISVLMILYFAYMEYKYSQTVGKMLLKIHVENTAGEKPAFWQTVVRSLFLLPVFPIMLLWIIDPIFFIFKGVRVSEMVSKTRTKEVSS